MTMTPLPASAQHRRHVHHDARERAQSLLARIRQPETLSLAEEMLELLNSVDVVKTHNLTLPEVAALKRMGIDETHMSTHASVAPVMQSRLGEAALEGESYSAAEVADRLGVTPTRVRQRAAEGTLIARRLSDGWRFPSFQFTAQGELPGWNRVATAVSPGTPLTLINEALHTPSSLLNYRGEDSSVAHWLLQGGDIPRAAEVMDILLNRMI